MASAKTALITGASSGIGKEFAKIHASRGGGLVIVARSEDKLNQLAEELRQAHNVQVTVLAKDLSAPGAPQEIYDAVKSSGIEVEYLINNAGFGGQGKFHERPWEDDLSMIQVNVLALTALTRLFLPDFVARGSGRVLNVSSTASLMPGPLQAVYFATKAFVTSFSHGLAGELAESPVTVTALLPGATETEFARASGMDKTDLFANAHSAEGVAKDGYEGMLKGELSVITGVSLSQRITFALAPLVPRKYLLQQVRSLQETK